MYQFPKFYSGMKLYMFRAVTLPIIRSWFTVPSALVYVIQVCRIAFEQDQVLSNQYQGRVVGKPASY
jgi:hypothetical protein